MLEEIQLFLKNKYNEFFISVWKCWIRLMVPPVTFTALKLFQMMFLSKQLTKRELIDEVQKFIIPF